MLDTMSFLEILTFYENGMKFEETRAKILVSVLGRAMQGNEAQPQQRVYVENPDQTPDRDALYSQFGDFIQRQ